jgi:hypothetical protein
MKRKRLEEDFLLILIQESSFFSILLFTYIPVSSDTKTKIQGIIGIFPSISCIPFMMSPAVPEGTSPRRISD